MYTRMLHEQALDARVRGTEMLQQMDLADRDVDPRRVEMNRFGSWAPGELRHFVDVRTQGGRNPLGPEQAQEFNRHLQEEATSLRMSFDEGENVARRLNGYADEARRFGLHEDQVYDVAREVRVRTGNLMQGGREDFVEIVKANPGVELTSSTYRAMAGLNEDGYIKYAMGFDPMQKAHEMERAAQEKSRQEQAQSPTFQDLVAKLGGGAGPAQQEPGPSPAENFERRLGAPGAAAPGTSRSSVAAGRAAGFDLGPGRKSVADALNEKTSAAQRSQEGEAAARAKIFEALNGGPETTEPEGPQEPGLRF